MTLALLLTACAALGRDEFTAGEYRKARIQADSDVRDAEFGLELATETPDPTDDRDARLELARAQEQKRALDEEIGVFEEHENLNGVTEFVQKLSRVSPLPGWVNVLGTEALTLFGLMGASTKRGRWNMSEAARRLAARDVLGAIRHIAAVPGFMHSTQVGASEVEHKKSQRKEARSARKIAKQSRVQERRAF